MQYGYRRGQVGLILLVVMGVVVSLVLSIATRSFSDVTLSRRERENNASFAVAEQGVEQALLNIKGGSLTGSQTSDSQGLVTGSFNIASSSSYDLYVDEGETAQIDLNATPSTLIVNWEKDREDPGTCIEGSGTAAAALELTFVSGTSTVKRYYYNSSGCSSMSSVNNFAASTDPGDIYNSQVNLSSLLVPGQKYLRVKPIYNGTTVNVTGVGLGQQLYLIKSQAAGGDAKTDIQVKRSLESAGSVFDYALFSNTTIIK